MKMRLFFYFLSFACLYSSPCFAQFVPLIFGTSMGSVLAADVSRDPLAVIKVPFPVDNADFKRADLLLDKRKFKEARAIYEQLATNGLPEASFRLACLWSYGLGGKRDLKKSADFFMQAAQGGLPQAQYRMGWILQDGVLMPQDKAQAFSWFLKAAQAGYSKAAFEVSSFYYLGDVIPKDRVEAFYWAREGAKRNEPQSLWLLGLYYWRGIGCAQNKDQAIHHLNLAANLGDKMAKKHLKAALAGKLK